MSGKIGNTHSFWHIIPRTSKSITIKLHNGNIINFNDVYWGTSFNNNIKYVPSNELLDYLRNEFIELILQSKHLAENFAFKIANPIEDHDVCKIKDCMQCDNAEADKKYLLFSTKNFRIILRPNDQRVPGRSLIIAYNHIHPDKFRGQIDLIIEQAIVEILLHKTFVTCYGYKRAQIMKLGNLTANSDAEHNHLHYMPSTDNEIVVKMDDGTELKIIDDRWGRATNINPKEGYTLVQRSIEIIDKIRRDFKENFVNVHDIKYELFDNLRKKGIDETVSNNLEIVLNKIISELNVQFD
jgi:hypothetical protein